MKLIKLEALNGDPIWVNPEWVVGLGELAAGVQVRTGEEMGDDGYWTVKGELDQVAAILMGDHDD